MIREFNEAMVNVNDVPNFVVPEKRDFYKWYNAFEVKPYVKVKEESGKVEKYIISPGWKVPGRYCAIWHNNGNINVSLTTIMQAVNNGTTVII